MIGPQPTGAVQGVSISATATEGLRITTTDGRPAQAAAQAMAEQQPAPREFVSDHDTSGVARDQDTLTLITLIDQRDKLLNALVLCYEHCRVYHPEVETNNVGEAVRAAIAKVEGGAG